MEFLVGEGEFDGGAKRVLEELGEDVFHVHGDVGAAAFDIAVDDEFGAVSVAELADLGNEGFGAAEDGGGRETSVDDADEVVRIDAGIEGDGGAGFKGGSVKGKVLFS